MGVNFKRFAAGVIRFWVLWQLI